MISLRTNQNNIITINKNNKIGKRGGEGTVYHIQSPSRYKNYCAKIYHDIQDRSKMNEREKKVLYMINNPIDYPINSPFIICSPIEALYDKNIFVGFIMPKAFANSESLAWLTDGYNISHTKVFNKFKKFDSSAGVQALYNRLVIINNFAYALFFLHKSNKYVLVDSKPENMLIDADGRISLIDIDSIQISQNKRVLFKASAWTPDYSPVERLYHKPNQMILPSWDVFSFSVVAYQLIIGSHPYNGTYISPYDKCDDIESAISKGLFIHGSKKSYLAHPNEPTIKNIFARWNTLPINLRKAFSHSFDLGHSRADKRLEMGAWGTVLRESLLSLQQAIKKKSSNNNVAIEYRWHNVSVFGRNLSVTSTTSVGIASTKNTGVNNLTNAGISSAKNVGITNTTSSGGTNTTSVVPQFTFFSKIKNYFYNFLSYMFAFLFIGVISVCLYFSVSFSDVFNKISRIFNEVSSYFNERKIYDGGESIKNNSITEDDYKIIKKNDKNQVFFGISDKNGNIVIPRKFACVTNFRNGIATVYLDGNEYAGGCINYSKKGFVNTKGEWVIDKKNVTDIRPFELDGYYGFVDQRGIVISSAKYKHISGPHEEVYNVLDKNNLWQFINKKTGEFIINDKFPCISRFREGLAAVSKKGYFDYNKFGCINESDWGYIDKKGNWVIPPKLDEARWFKNGKANIVLNGEKLTITKEDIPWVNSMISD